MSTLDAPTTPARSPVRPAPPPLQPGDRLTRAEFERRYEATRGVTKAELIEGIVYMPPPPVSFTYHSAPHADVLLWLGLYRLGTPGVLGGDNGSLRLDLDNEPQPDAFLMIDPRLGGQAKIDEEGYVAGAPELIAEVAASSASYDLHAKMHAYRRNGVREYVVWRTYDGEIDWFSLRDGEYHRFATDASGIYRSEIIPGLWLDAAAMLRGDLTALAAAVQAGLKTPEHERFVAALAATVAR